MKVLLLRRSAPFMARRLRGRRRLVTATSRAPRVLPASLVFRNLEAATSSTALSQPVERAVTTLTTSTMTFLWEPTPPRLLAQPSRTRLRASQPQERVTLVSPRTAFFTPKLAARPVRPTQWLLPVTLLLVLRSAVQA